MNCCSSGTGMKARWPHCYERTQAWKITPSQRTNIELIISILTQSVANFRLDPAIFATICSPSSSKSAVGWRPFASMNASYRLDLATVMEWAPSCTELKCQQNVFFKAGVRFLLEHAHHAGMSGAWRFHERQAASLQTEPSFKPAPGDVSCGAFALNLAVVSQKRSGWSGSEPGPHAIVGSLPVLPWQC